MRSARITAAGRVRLRRSGLLLGVFALLFQAALPLSGMPMTRGVAGLSGDYPSTSDVAAARQKEPANRDGQGGGRDAPPCPICQFLQQFGAYLPPAAAAITQPVALSVAGEPPSGPVFSPNRASSFYRVRAPPLSA